MLENKPKSAPEVMRTGYSTYLDIVRFLMAMQVFLMHAEKHGIFTRQIGFLTLVQSDAVMVFFVLSGLVIAYVDDAKRRSARLFMSERLARLWSVMIPAIALSLLVDVIISTGSVRWQPYVASLFFLNQGVFGHYEPHANPPLWSLSYEFWYYVLFAGAIILRGLPRIITIAIGAAFAGPNILLLFPVWVMGALSYRLSVVQLSKLLSWTMFLLPPIIYLGFLVTCSPNLPSL